MENDLPEGKARQVLDFMVSHGQDAIREILTVKKLFGTSGHSYQYYVMFKPGTLEEVIGQVMDQTFLFLDIEEDDYALDIPDEKQIRVLRKNVPRCSVYQAE